MVAGWGDVLGVLFAKVLQRGDGKRTFLAANLFHFGNEGFGVQFEEVRKMPSY